MGGPPPAVRYVFPGGGTDSNRSLFLFSTDFSAQLPFRVPCVRSSVFVFRRAAVSHFFSRNNKHPFPTIRLRARSRDLEKFTLNDRIGRVSIYRIKEQILSLNSPYAESGFGELHAFGVSKRKSYTGGVRFRDKADSLKKLSRVSGVKLQRSLPLYGV